MITHLNLVSNALALSDIWHFTSDDVLLHALPIFHTHGLFVAINDADLAYKTTFLQSCNARGIPTREITPEHPIRDRPPGLRART